MDKKKKERIAGITIIACAAIVIFWEGMGLLASRPGDDYALKPEDLESFELSIPGWRAERLPISSTFQEVNLLKLRLAPENGMSRTERTEAHRGEAQGTKEDQTTKQPNNLATARDIGTANILVRLVHGYNMVDCMRIKGYTVEEMNGVVNGYGLEVNSKTAEAPAAPNNQSQGTNNSLDKAQLWKLTSSSGDTSLWLSGMIRAGDFAATDLSTTDMAFPKIGIPDDPSWKPRGLTWKSLRHPIRNFRYFMRAKWNNSRCDMLTFLGLRRPAWASEDALTLLIIADEGNEGGMAGVYVETLRQLQEWKRSAEGDGY